MQAYNILLLGSGGRESAICRKLRESPLCGELFIAPGNAGTARYGTNLSLAVKDFEAIRRSCLAHHIDILIPGGEDALVAGIADYFQQDVALRHILVVGPSRTGAMLEGSKAFAKQFMQRHGIPTAAYREFGELDFEAGIHYIREHSLPVVLKADGLAAGKGVVICTDTEEAVTHFTAMIREGRFGDAGRKVVIEAFLSGIELSVFVLTDGSNYFLLPEAKDYKRIGEGDTGSNTGGMGAVSPVPFADTAFMQKVAERIITPTVKGLQEESIPYQGFIFFGLISVEGEPYVIEYNCRLGDPETEVLLPRLKNDLVALILQMGKQQLAEATAVFDGRTACTVMLVSEGYPDSYKTGHVITGLAEDAADFIPFQAGTAFQGEKIITAGGRVVAVTAYGDTMAEALKNCYAGAKKIHFEGCYYRKDIGYEFLKK